jgi:hypothetical protein
MSANDYSRRKFLSDALLASAAVATPVYYWDEALEVLKK